MGIIRGLLARRKARRLDLAMGQIQSDALAKSLNPDAEIKAEGLGSARGRAVGRLGKATSRTDWSGD